MINFSFKEYLTDLKHKNFDLNINKNIDILNQYENYQLINLSLLEGLKLNNIIRLNFINNVGFRCYNLQTEKYGRLPICKNIEKFLNKKYNENLTQKNNVIEFLKSEIINWYDYNNWNDFVDDQKLGDCQMIVNFLSDLSDKFNLPIEPHFGEIKIDEEYYNVHEDEYIDKFTHHWITIENEIYEFSKGTLKDFIEWDNLYDLDPELREYLQIR